LAAGETMYFGSTVDCLPYFETLNVVCGQHYNPADFLMEIVMESPKLRIDYLAKYYRNSQHFQQVKKAIQQMKINKEVDVSLDFLGQKLGEYASTFYFQVWMLCKRTLTHNLRNPYLLRLQVGLTFLLAFGLGLIYWKVDNTQDGVQNRAGALFFMLALLTFGSMSSNDICKNFNI
jgi:hypothetical protein